MSYWDGRKRAVHATLRWLHAPIVGVAAVAAAAAAAIGALLGGHGGMVSNGW